MGVPGDWIEHRRGDGERLGWLRPEGDGFVVIDLLGRPRTDALDWLAAEEAIEALGIGYLAGRFELLRDTGEWLRVRIMEVSPSSIRVKREDGGDVGVPLLAFELPFPMPDSLRPIGD